MLIALFLILLAVILKLGLINKDLNDKLNNERRSNLSIHEYFLETFKKKHRRNYETWNRRSKNTATK
jgi:hypothetical protein